MKSKKILITGANSYIGESVESYLNRITGQYTVETVDMIDGSWRQKDFSPYDTVFHVAGIAHSDSGKISAEKERLYRSVNTDLAVETAKKAKEQGAGQFIFMSSAIVYGNSAPIGKQKMITKDTVPTPANCYGDSKLQAEHGILPLQDENFKVVVLRPPMIYGKQCKGNYTVMAKMAKKLPVFPKIQNSRSMLYIENLCEFVRLMIDNEEHGIFFPQNAEYSNTSEMVRMIAATHGKKIHLTRMFNWAFPLCRHFVGAIDKAFGNLTYDKELSEYKTEYRLFGLAESIERTERTEV